jgi:hypothetical protein
MDIFLILNIELSFNVTKLLGNRIFNVNIFIYLLEEQLKSYQMKKYIVIGTMLMSGMIFAQNTAVKPKLEAVGNLVKATFLYDDGQVKQEGFYENGKLQGKWVSYDVNGNKTAVAEYNKGQKVGKWFFWNDSILSEVDYSDNRVAAVKNWKPDAIANVD